MPAGFGGRGAWRIWWAGVLSLGVGLVGGLGDLRAQQHLPADPAGLPGAKVALRSAPADVVVVPGGPLDEALAGIGARLDQLSRLAAEVRARQDGLAALGLQNQRSLARIEALEAERDRLLNALRRAEQQARASREENAQLRGLAEELIAQRRENVRLSSDLAEATADRSAAEQAARAHEAALAAWIGSLRDELAQTAAARTEAEARLEQQARASQAERVRAQSQLAAMADQLRERKRQMASVRSENLDLRQRLDAAQAELRRQGAENALLAAELATSRMAAESATTMAQETLAAIETQIGVLHAAAGDASPGLRAGEFAPDWAGRPVELLSASLVDVLPAMPHPKPRAGEGIAWAPAADAAHGGGLAAARAMAAVEDGPWVPARLLDVAVGEWEPTPARATALTPDGPEIVDIMSMAALVPEPLAAGGVAPREDGVADRSAGALRRGNGSGLQEAAARLADGLRTTRAEAVFSGQERVFTVDVAARAFAASPAAVPVPLDPALDIHLWTAKSELVGEGRGRIRFFPDGSSTGGRIDLELLGDRATVNVRWSSGIVTVER